jgi:hypothetical protein
MHAKYLWCTDGWAANAAAARVKRRDGCFQPCPGHDARQVTAHRIPSQAPDGKTVVLAVLALDGWTERWRLDTTGQVLVACEFEAGGRAQRRFEVYGDHWDQPVRWAGELGLLGAFQRAADPAWRSASTIAR